MDDALSAIHTSGHRALRKGRISLPGTVYLVTATTFERQALFGHFAGACVVAATFENRTLLGTNRLLAWVLMPDHAHWLIQLGAGERLEASIGRLKAVSSRNFNCRLGREGKVWAPAFHDRGLRREEDLRRVARYVVANPLRAGLVRRVGDYPFWNAVWL